MDFDKNLANLNSPEFQRYLKYYETFQADRKKCYKSQKCQDTYTETPTELKVKKGESEKVVKKPKYIFIKPEIERLKNEMKSLEVQIRNYRFIVETNTSKKIREEFTKVKDAYLKTTNTIKEMESYLSSAGGKEENKDKMIDAKSGILEQDNIKRELYFQIQRETDETEKKKLIEEYLDRKEINKNKKIIDELNKTSEMDYMVEELPSFPDVVKAPRKKKKVERKRCPPGQRKNKTTGECEEKKN